MQQFVKSELNGKGNTSCGNICVPLCFLSLVFESANVYPSAMELENLKQYFPNRVITRRVRAVAVKRVRKDLILHGKSEDDLSEQELEYLLADAEQSVWGDIKQTSLIGILAMLGLSIG